MSIAKLPDGVEYSRTDRIVELVQICEKHGGVGSERQPVECVVPSPFAKPGSPGREGQAYPLR